MAYSRKLCDYVLDTFSILPALGIRLISGRWSTMLGLGTCNSRPTPSCLLTSGLDLLHNHERVSTLLVLIFANTRLLPLLFDELQRSSPTKVGHSVNKDQGRAPCPKLKAAAIDGVNYERLDLLASTASLHQLTARFVGFTQASRRIMSCP